MMNDEARVDADGRGQGRLLGIAIGLVALLLDQFSKWVIVSVVMQPPRVIEITPFLNIVLVRNRGVSFGLFASDSPYGPWVLTGLVLVILTVLAVWLVRAENRLQALAIGIIMGGGLGNVVDRLRIGAVVDFIQFHAPGLPLPPFYAFNVADSCVFVGVVLILYDALFVSRR